MRRRIEMAFAVVAILVGSVFGSESLSLNQTTIADVDAEIVTVEGTIANTISLALVFTIDTSVVSPADPFILTNAFSGLSGEQTVWNLHGDTVFVSTVAGVPVSVTDGVVLAFAFLRRGVTSETTTLTWVPFPLTNSDEQPITLFDGELTTAGTAPWSWTVFVDIECANATVGGAQIAFTIDTTVVRPADPLVVTSVFANTAGAIVDWNLYGDTIFVAMASGISVPLAPTALVRLAFVIRTRELMGIPVQLLGFPLTHVDDNDVLLVPRLAHANPTAVAEPHHATGLTLHNAPNPFNPITTVHYSLPATGDIDLVVMNAAGQRVCTIYRGNRSAGEHSVVWDGRDDHGRAVASGVYFCRLVTQNQVRITRMTLAR
jgi:flagellar hook capping protein FlgD